MHDKGVNVFVSSENMPELLLNEFKSKQSIKWQENSMNKKYLPTIHVHNDIQPNGKVSEVIKIRNIEEIKNGFSQPELNFCPREGGTKRIREESLTIANGSNCEGDGRPYKMKLINDNLKNEAGHFSRIGKTVTTGEKLEPTEHSMKCISNVCEQDSSIINGNCIENGVNFNGANRKTNDMENTYISSDFEEVHFSTGVQIIDNECQYLRDNLLHPGLRLSLFPRVPPYIKFSPYDAKGERFPIHIHKLLRWKLSSITPLVVRKVIVNSGFRLFRKSTYWGGTWGTHPKSVGFKTLFDYQKMNHFPGTFQIGRKDRLWKSLQKLMAKFGKNKFDLMPTTYILPRDKKLLRIAWKKTEGAKPWIIKPPASSRGTGIKVVHKWKQIPDNSPVVVQSYISRPFLINDAKFDLRLYVLITSVDPLRVYLYDNGLVRFASTKYSSELNTLGDRYVHLTNYSINKLSSMYKQNEDAESCQGHKWTLKTLWNYMDKELHLDVEKLRQRLVDLIVKTVISGEHSMTQLTNVNLQSRYNAYELFGIDVLLDEDLKPWLLEVNISPSLHSASPLDLAVKAPLVYDLMNIVGFQIPCSNKFTETELCNEMGNIPDNRLCFDSRIYTRSLSVEEKLKHQQFVQKARDEYLDSILNDLTSDDVRHLILAEDELTQIGSFHKVFPTPTSHEYLRYLDNPRYYNCLFDAWETKYHENREEGVQLLREKCEKYVHLCLSKSEPCLQNICEPHQKCRQKIQNNLLIEHSMHFQNTSYIAMKMKTAYLMKPRYRLRRSFVPNRTYLLGSRKPR